MTAQSIAAIITCAITVGAVLIFIGRALHTLTNIDNNQIVLFDRTEGHSKEIARLDKELTRVATRQEDCDNCP